MAYLRRNGSERTYRAATTVIHRGEPGRAFFVVLEGELEVLLSGRDGLRLPLARLEPGASFGEMALLRDEPVSADVVTLGATKLLEVPANRFHAALAECEPLRTQLLARLADNLDRTTGEAWRSHLRAETLDTLIHHQPSPEPLVARSPAMRTVNREVDRLAASDTPLLLHGGPGTGKLLVAATVHARSPRAENPLVVVDGLKLQSPEAPRVLLGSAAEAGFESTVTSFGLLHLADRGTLVLRHLEVLPADCQRGLAAYLDHRAMTERRSFPDVRVMATLRGDPDRHLDGGRLAVELAARLQALPLPRISLRRHDILPLAELFVAGAGDGEPRRLAPDARRALVSTSFDHRNVAELREALELASLVTDGPEIRAEHLFTGATDEGFGSWFDLSRFRITRRLAAGRMLGLVRAAVLASFVGAILVGLTAAGQSLAARLTNGFVWSIWEPAVFALFLLAGRVWCTVCPLSTAGRLAQRVVCLDRPPPVWAKQSGLWLGIGGFLLIIWSEQVFHMTGAPLATAVMLSGLIAASVVLSVVYRREVWCRYLCPLGMLATGYAPPAPLQVRADRNVCATLCTTHDCYRGSEKAQGCPVFHHPMVSAEGHACKLCLECLDTCPHGSARLYLRPPLQSLWRLPSAAAAFAPFAVAVFMLSLVLLASQGPGWVAGPTGLTTAALLAVGLGVVLALRLPFILSGGEEPAPALGARVAFALLVLGWGPLMAAQAANVSGLPDLHLSATPGSAVATLLTGPVPVLPLVQLGMVLLAAVLAAVTLWRIRAGARREELPLSGAGWRAVLWIGATYLAGALGLIL